MKKALMKKKIWLGKSLKAKDLNNKSTSTNDLEDYVQGKHVNVEVEDFLEIDNNAWFYEAVQTLI